MEMISTPSCLQMADPLKSPTLTFLRTTMRKLADLLGALATPTTPKMPILFAPPRDISADRDSGSLHREMDPEGREMSTPVVRGEKKVSQDLLHAVDVLTCMSLCRLRLGRDQQELLGRDEELAVVEAPHHGGGQGAGGRGQGAGREKEEGWTGRVGEKAGGQVRRWSK